MKSSAEIPDGDGDEFPKDIAALEQVLIRQREYTLALYADLPDSDWVAKTFPYLEIVNPPLWELTHIAWFAEFFCLRWRPEDPEGLQRPSSLTGADALFDSRRVAHRDRWLLDYPSRKDCMEYMEQCVSDVCAGLREGGVSSVGRDPYQLAVAHEDMHAEALLMTIQTLGRPWPKCAPRPAFLPSECEELFLAGGILQKGHSNREFQFDNELPTMETEVRPFSISSRPVTVREWREFRHSSAYDREQYWTREGIEWKRLRGGLQPVDRPVVPDDAGAALHISAFEAEAFCRWIGRRLPTEAEWEFAAVRSPTFRASTGHVWEWTSSSFLPHEGFAAGRYADYSRPWFGDHQVLKGGSFATQPRLRYPQYRNFYRPWRSDMFCGFRTAAI